MTVKIFAGGDTVIRRYRTAIVSDKIEQLIQDADLAICNFEGPIQSHGKPIVKAGPHVFQHPKALEMLKAVGFTHCSLANNHIYDYGEIGLGATLDAAAENNIQVVGAGRSWEDAYALVIYEVKNIKVGLLAFCEAEFGCLLAKEQRGGYAYINHGCVCKLIMDARTQVDILVIIVHAGAEEVPLPLPEWRARYRELCDFGADAVIAHHPHVPQGWELYDGKPIFYSLGNFYFDRADLKLHEYPAYSVILEFNKKGLINFVIVPHRYINAITCPANDPQLDKEFEKLCLMLGEGYEALANEQAVMLYNTRYRPYYLRALGGIDPNWPLIKKCVGLVKTLFSPQRSTMQHEILLLHNIRIDSHRYVAQRALSLKWERSC